ncbi:MAG: DedA family protein [Candidatus Roizmanbacteria bacterium]
MHLDLITLLPQIGLIGIIAVIFAESGLLVGFFLPGDSLLFTAGFLASQGVFSIWYLVPLCVLAAIAGDSVGYLFGKKVGKKLFQKEDSLFFHKDNIIRAQDFYEKHGKKTIIIARFIPIVRTFAPIVAGIGDMHYSTFIMYNIVGGMGWAAGVPLAGYFLGRSIPDVDKYLLPIILLIILVSLAPPVYHILGDKESRDKILNMIRGYLKK